MRQLIRTNAANPGFLKLVKALDVYLQKMNGEDHSFFVPLNAPENIKQVVLVVENNEPVGCGAMKVMTATTMEIKRMYVLPEKRNQGLASLILKELERWAADQGYTDCILETGQHMKDAIYLYTRNGYSVIPRYGPYVDVADSVCFAKQIR